jgi:hypothetical protein
MCAGRAPVLTVGWALMRRHTVSTTAGNADRIIVADAAGQLIDE